MWRRMVGGIGGMIQIDAANGSIEDPLTASEEAATVDGGADRGDATPAAASGGAVGGDDVELVVRRRAVGSSGAGTAGDGARTATWRPQSSASTSGFESLDYELMDNHKIKSNADAFSANAGVLKIHAQFVGYTTMKWLFALLIGIFTAILAFVINLCVENGSAAKFGATLWVMNHSYFLSFLVYLVFNVAFVFCSAMLVAYIAPAAAGSGACCALSSPRYEHHPRTHC